MQQKQQESQQQQQLAVRLSAADGPASLDGVSTLVLDCDGVLWRGTQLLPGTVQALERFRQMGKRLLFLTNNSSKSRRAYKAGGSCRCVPSCPCDVLVDARRLAECLLCCMPTIPAARLRPAGQVRLPGHPGGARGNCVYQLHRRRVPGQLRL